MENSRKRIWESPWGFTEYNLIVWSIVLVGFVLNYNIGNFDFFLLARPYNFFFGGGIVLFIILLSLFRKKTILFKFFSSLELSVGLISTLTVLCIIMGLTPQILTSEGIDPGIKDNFFTRLGLRQMTTSWSFVLIYFLTLISLGSIIIKRLFSKNKKKILFTLNHLGLWMVLFFSALGYSDLQRYIMYVNKSEIEWRVYDSNQEAIELPIAIKLNDFIIEDYIPKLAIIDRKTGEIEKTTKVSYLQLDTNTRNYSFNGYKITLNNYIHSSIPNGDTSFRFTPMLGSTPSANISLKDRKTNKVISGWISSGNYALMPRALNIDTNLALVMTKPEPKAFISDIEVFTQDEKYKKARIEVNKPLKIGSWWVYQYGYDNEMGKLSNYSSFELVHDPWLYFVYFGIFLLGVGGVLLVILGKKSI